MMSGAIVWLLFVQAIALPQDPLPDVDELVAVFDDGTQPLLRRLHAGRLLYEHGPAAAAAIPRLRARLKDPETCIRRRAGLALSRIDSDPVPAHVTLIDDPDSGIARDAYLALRRLGAVSLIPLLAELKSEDAGRRRRVARILGRFAPIAQAAVAPLIERLKDEDVGVRERAAWALGQFGDSARPAEAALALALTDPNPGVRRSAAAALARLVPEADATITPLEAALQDPDVRVRRSVAGAFLRMEGKARASLSCLTDAAKGDDPVVAEIAGRVVRRLAPDAELPRPPSGVPPTAPLASPSFYLRTMDQIPADVFINGKRAGRTTYCWSLGTDTRYDERIPIRAWPPEGSTPYGLVLGKKVAARLRIAPGRAELHSHLAPGEHLLYSRGNVGTAFRRGAQRLRIVGDDGSLYRHLVWDPVLSGDEDRNAFRYLRAVWFEAVPER